MSVDLTTRYLGLDLQHPLVASSSPLSKNLDGIRRLEDGGASAVVLFSLFEERIRQEEAAQHRLTQVGSESFGEALSYFPAVEGGVGPHAYLELLRKAREAVDVPVIASLNGVTPAGWTDYARSMEEAGADAVELNVFYIPSESGVSGREVEARYVEIVERVRKAVSIPLAVKVGPYFSSMGEMAERFVEAGADGLVLFNRFYQPDLDLDALEIRPDLELSTAGEIRLPLLWIALLRGRLSAGLAATTGVEGGREAAKYLLAGADAVMATSALLRHGPERMGDMVSELEEWMAGKGYASVEEMRGAMSREKAPDPAAFERANYLKALEEYRSPWGPA